MCRGRNRPWCRPTTRRPAAARPVRRCRQRRDEGNRAAIQHLIDQQTHQGTCPLDTHIRRADLPFDLGPDMPHLPGRPARLHDAQDVAGCLGDLAGVGDPGGLGRRGERCLHHRRDRAASAQHYCGFAEPGGALLGQGSGFVFGVAGLQGRLLRQMQCFDRGQWPPVIMLELDGQLAAAGVDVGAAGGPALVQSGVDADDLPDRPFRRVGPGRSVDRTPNVSRRCSFQCGFVGLRGGNVGFEQHSVRRWTASVHRGSAPCSRPRHGCVDPGLRPGCRGG